MKHVLLLLLLISTPHLQADDYFVTPSGSGDGSGRGEADAMSYAALFEKPLEAGDRVFFKAGEVYSGQLWARSGVTYGRYGAGANPIISGFTALTSWTPSGDNIYYASLSGSRYHGVTLDGVVQAMGRYPNSGYLTYTGADGSKDDPSTAPNEFTPATHITGPTVAELPFNAVGAEVCIRKYRWIIDRHIVTGHTGDRLEFSSTAFYGNNRAYLPHAGNGYFIQAHLATLDCEGEWWFDDENGRLYMHFGEGTPDGRGVKVSTLDQVVPLNTVTDITFNDIDFEGGNTAIVINSSRDITLNNCNFRSQGTSAVHGSGASRFTMKGGSVSDALNNAFDFPTDASGVTIEGVAISGSGAIAGAGYSGDGGYCGVFVVGTGTTVRNCAVTNTGYNAVHCNGSEVLVEENYIDTFCTVKDDGAGVYTYLGSDTPMTNMVIRRNVVLNAVGAYAGSESFGYEAFGKAAGIYIDGYTNHALVEGNVVAHGEWGGIFLNGNSHNQVLRNIVYDFASQLMINLHTSAGLVRGIEVTGNQFIARTASQRTLEVNMYVEDDLALLGTFDNNCYARPASEGATIRVNRAYPGADPGDGGARDMELADWKSAYGADAASTASAVSADNPDRLRLEYATGAAAAVPLTGVWRDVTGESYRGRLVLDKYSGRVLVADAATGDGESSATAPGR